MPRRGLIYSADNQTESPAKLSRQGGTFPRMEYPNLYRLISIRRPYHLNSVIIETLNSTQRPIGGRARALSLPLAFYDVKHLTAFPLLNLDLERKAQRNRNHPRDIGILDLNQERRIGVGCGRGMGTGDRNRR